MGMGMVKGNGKGQQGWGGPGWGVSWNIWNKETAQRLSLIRGMC